jgi:hypothetical protein
LKKKAKRLIIPLKNRFAFQLYKTLFVALRLRFPFKQFERFETLHGSRPPPLASAQF